MKQRGRPPSAAIELLSAHQVLDRTPRQKPPADLTSDECEIWWSVVDSEAADWFSPVTVPLLAQFCRHCIRARYVASLIEASTGRVSLDDYDRLLKMQERETRALTTVATKMRLTQQSTINQRGNRNGATANPWEG